MIYFMQRFISQMHLRVNKVIHPTLENAIAHLNVFYIHLDCPLQIQLPYSIAPLKVVWPNFQKKKHKVQIQFKYYCPVQIRPHFYYSPKTCLVQITITKWIQNNFIFIICYYILPAQISITNWFERQGCFLCGFLC